MYYTNLFVIVVTVISVSESSPHKLCKSENGYMTLSEETDILSRFKNENGTETIFINANKDLILDEKFSWADQIHEICSKLSQVAGIIFKIRHLLNREAMMLLYHGLVGSKLRYGLICWATASKYLLDKINVSHNKIITYIGNYRHKPFVNETVIN